MRRRCSPALFAALLAIAALALPSRASAYERQWHAGVGLGYGLLGDGGGSGFGGGLHLTYGLNDAFNAMAEIDTTYHPGSKTLLASGSLGVGYVLDILQWVPYAGVMAGVYEQIDTASSTCGDPGQPGCFATRLGFSVPVGLDYQLSRSVAVGVAGRYHFIFLGSNGVTNALTAFARVEYIWGY